MVDVAQSVRVTDCGSEGRGFESHLPPKQNKRSKEMSQSDIFLFLWYYGANSFADIVTENKRSCFTTPC